MDNNLFELHNIEYYDEDSCKFYNVSSCEIRFNDETEEFLYEYSYKIDGSTWKSSGRFSPRIATGDILSIDDIINSKAIVLRNLALPISEYNKFVDYIIMHFTDRLREAEINAESIHDRALQLISNEKNFHLLNRFVETYAMPFYCHPDMFSKMECAFWEEYCEPLQSEKYGAFFLLSTNTYTRESLREKIEEEIEPKWWKVVVRIKDGNLIYQYFDRLFKPLTELLSDSNDLEKNEAPFLTYIAIQMVVLKYIGKKWENEYRDYFLNIQDMDLDDCMFSYLSIKDINHESFKSFSEFVYYLMYKEKLDANRGYINNFYTLLPYYQKNKEIKQAALRKRNLEKELVFGEKANINVDDIDMMSGVEFELFLANYFSSIGYETEVTKSSGDQGIDIILRKDEISIGVQAKCYSGSVGNSAIQQAVAGKLFYHLDKVMVITNSIFTSSAIELAQANDVILWDRTILKERICE